ncbi:MAG: RecBCD nuclease inhibitor [Gammaproteobacteria bacterium]|nr:RecBCD nuclease inhibitor [Gammaproteobacteria bacterium]
MDTVTIPKAQYDKLVTARDLLNALYAVGVDNWDGYTEARNEIEGLVTEETPREKTQ